MPRCPHWKPLPWTNGLKVPSSARAKCLTGKIDPTVPTQAGAPAVVKNRSETKATGKKVKLAITGAASPLGMTAATAMPREQKQAAPSSRVTAAAGSIRVITSTRNSSPATTTMTTALTSENHTAERMRALM
jgi:hypothetical protein